MGKTRRPWEVLCATVFSIVACGGDDPANPLDDGTPPSETLAECTPEGNTTGWTFTRLGEGAKPAIALGGDGTVHIAFMNESTQGWVRYAPLAVGADAPGALETVDAGYFYGPIDIVMGSDDQPWVLFHDHTREDQVLALRDASGSWSLQPMLNSGHDGWYNAGVLDAAGTLHTAAYDPRGFDGQGVTYGVWDGSAWSTEIAAQGSFDYAGGMSIALTADGTVHIAFFDDGAGEARLASQSGDGTWDVTTIEALEGGVETGRFPDLAVGLDGETLHLVYFARSSATQGVVRYATGVPGDFQVTDLLDVSDFSIGFSGARDIATLDLDSSGRPVVAVQDRSQLRVLRVMDGGTEMLADFRAASGVEFKQQTDVAVDDQGRVHVAWWQSGAVPGTVCHAMSG